MTEEQRIERVESYLNGTMSAEERNLFDSELTRDQNLREELGRHMKAKNAIAYLNRKELKQKLQSIDSERNSTGTQPRIRKLAIRVAIAASIVLLAGFGIVFTTGYFGQETSLASLSEEYFVPTKAESFRGSDTETASTYTGQLMQADLLYQSGDYEQAIIEYKRLSMIDNARNDLAEWNLVMSYLLSESHESECDKILDQIAADKTHAYNTWAVRLKKELKN